MQDILAEIERRKRAQSALEQKRQALLKQLKAIDAQLGHRVAVPAAAKPGRAAKRAKNTVTLPEAMLKVMTKDKGLSVPEIAKAVTRVGYRSVSKTFHTIIYQTLARDKRFKRLARGRYVKSVA